MSLHTFTLDDNSERPIDYETSLLPKDFPIRTKLCHSHGSHSYEISICTCQHNILHRHVHIHNNTWLAKNICVDRLHFIQI